MAFRAGLDCALRPNGLCVSPRYEDCDRITVCNRGPGQRESANLVHHSASAELPLDATLLWGGAAGRGLGGHGAASRERVCVNGRMVVGRPNGLLADVSISSLARLRRVPQCRGWVSKQVEASGEALGIGRYRPGEIGMPGRQGTPVCDGAE